MTLPPVSSLAATHEPLPTAADAADAAADADAAAAAAAAAPLKCLSVMTAQGCISNCTLFPK